jgi:diacylglycerol kinase (ATP)
MGYKVDVAIAKPKEKTIPIARKAVKQGYKTIVAMGGDDTIEAIIRGMAGSKARLGMIPVGTANNLAKSLGIPEDVKEACALIASGKFRKLDMGQAKVKKSKKIPFFELVMVGIGAEVYPDALHVSKGKLKDLKGLLDKTFKHETMPKMSVKMNGDSVLQLDTMLTIVSNVPLIGPNMLVDPDASIDDGLFDILIYPNYNKAQLIEYFAKSTGETAPQDGKIQRYRASRITIKSKPKLEVMADGVMLGRGKVKIKLLPGALRVYAPQPGTGVEKPPHETGADLPTPIAPVVNQPEEAKAES